MAGEGLIKRSVAGPVKAFARKLSRYCEVVVMDEFWTNKKHFDCQTPENLENQRVMRMCRDGVVRKVPVHKVPVHKVLLCLRKH
ncbi:hypothetical protein P3T76_008697 [Phytophthora citrophthora]|uniref:Uncharacterized protein n=1 Tax=Phytophthora citrophthora TaxID=4793 RepID=A0AAD9GJ64_9STRA|nr:hypothetical protein P3T76_008697 [Phytophthora citrophthora]